VKLFERTNNTIDRINRINDEDLIPKNLIIKKNKTAVESFVCGVIENDEDYGHFDKPINEPLYQAVKTANIRGKMEEFLQKHKYKTICTITHDCGQDQLKEVTIV